MELIELRKDEYLKASELADLAREIWTEHYTPIIGSAQVEYMLHKYQSTEKILDSIENNGYRYFIASEGENPAGYCAIKLEHEKGGIFLSKLYMKKSFRGRGGSRLFLDKLLEIAKDNKLDHIWLTVNKQNLNSIEIYKRLGFMIIEDVTAGIGSGYVMDDYKMQLDISRV